RENPAVTSDSTGPSEEAAGRSEAAMRTRLARANASRPRERRNPSSGEVVMGTSFQTAVVSRRPVRADCALAWDGARRTRLPVLYRWEFVVWTQADREECAPLPAHCGGPGCRCRDLRGPLLRHLARLGRSLPRLRHGDGSCRE